MSILLRCNGFAGIQKAAVDPTGSKPLKQWPWPFSDANLALGSALELLLNPVTELVIVGCCIKSTFCCTPQSDQEMVQDKTTFQNDYFILGGGQLMRHPFIKLSNLPQMPNNRRLVKAEFFCNFSCSYKISLQWLLPVDHCHLLMTSHCTPHLQGSCRLCKFLEPSLHCNTAPNINNALWKIRPNAVFRYIILSEHSL